jgi:hypothetical protein
MVPLVFVLEYCLKVTDTVLLFLYKSELKLVSAPHIQVNTTNPTHERR